MTELELTITALAAGGDGVARDAAGRVTFVPRTAPGDRVRARLVRETASFARGELVELVAASPARVDPPCPAFAAGCGGCQWLHVARAEQLAAKQAIVAGALRKLPGLAIEPIADPCPPLGWRRRARFHVQRGRLGLYAASSHRVIALARCPQLAPALDAVLARVIAAAPPEGELALVLGHRGDIAIGAQRAWPGAAALVGGGVVGVVAGGVVHGEPVVELEPGLLAGPLDFAQASAAGNAALVARVASALGPGPGRALELHAGAGNFTRALRAAGWDVTPSDAVAHDLPGLEAGTASDVLARLPGPFDAIVLDPPRTGAAEATDGIARHAPRAIVYISCDPATLGRDAGRLVAAGYRAERAWPIDVMPQTAHVEVVLRLTRTS